MTLRARTAAIGTLTLIVGFAVAQGSGARWLGGVILVIGGAIAVALGWRFAGPVRTLASVAVFVAAFVVSHPLGHAIGAWPSVLLMSAGSGAVAYWLLKPTATVPA